MARLLHDGHHDKMNDVDDLCADFRDDSDCDDSTSDDCTGDDSKKRRRRHDSDCGCKDRNHKKRRRKKHRRCPGDDLIPVGNITVDCTAVSFSTGGQVRNVVSCAVDEVVNVPITQTTFVQTPGPFGCTICQPVTQTVQVPVVTTVNVPPTLVPFPRIVCPPTVCEVVDFCKSREGC